MGKLNLKTEIDPNAGFCFGVVEAINKAEKAIYSGEELYCLGEIVHNDEEVKRLSEKGMQTIYHDDLKKLKGKTILFRAHGEHPKSYKIVLDNNNKIIDASCPIIMQLQKRIKESYQNNENIIIFGKKDHPEVIALMGQINDSAIIIERIEDINTEIIPKSVTIYSQTTRSVEKYQELVDILKNAGKNVTVKNTICRSVSKRHPQLTKFCGNFTKILFVGGKKSSNAKVLYNICKNANQKAYFISKVDEIDISWFNENDTVGISGATSTPQWLMEEVKKYLENL